MKLKTSPRMNRSNELRLPNYTSFFRNFASIFEHLRSYVTKERTIAILSIFILLVLVYHYFYGHFVHGLPTKLLRSFSGENRDGFDNQNTQEDKQWHEYVGVIYYINLDDREDRKTQFLKEMRRMGVPDDKVVRISAVNKPGKGDWGCSLSHLITIQQFIDSGLDNCIVFEDDFIFTRELQDINTDFREVFGKSFSYDVIMLSASDIQTEDIEHAHLKKVKDAQTTSGYMVNKYFAPVLLENYKDGAKLIEKSYEGGKSDKLQGPFCVDQYWKKLQPQSNWFIFSPKLGLQRESHSDIQGGVVNYGI